MVISEVIHMKFCRNLPLIRGILLVDALEFHTWLVSEINFMTVLQGLVQNTNYKYCREKNTNKCCKKNITFIL